MATVPSAQKYDFFDLYGLTVFNASNPNYYGFMPIEISMAESIDETTQHGNGNVSVGDSALQGLSFKLPWLVGEISDSVSVSFTRRGANQAENILYNAVADMMQKWFNSDVLSEMIMAKYDPTSLTKKLDLEFILPIALGSGQKLSKNASIANIRKALGALEGLVYPRGAGFGYPPLLKVSINGIHKGFKGYLTEVSIRESEEHVIYNGEMFPLVIKGSLKFVNLFMYSWSIGGHTLFGQLDLGKDPSILFGDPVDNGSPDFSTSTGIDNSSPAAATENPIPTSGNNSPFDASGMTSIGDATDLGGEISNSEWYTTLETNGGIPDGSELGQYSPDNITQQFSEWRATSGIEEQLASAGTISSGLSAKSLFGNVLSSAGKALKNVGAVFNSTAGNILRNVTSLSGKILSSTVTNITNKANSILTGSSIMSGNLPSLGSAITDTAKNTAVNIINSAVGDVMTNASGIINDIAKIPATAITDANKTIITGMASDASKVLAKGKEALEKTAEITTN
jgi:hypothetical protein